ncbi:MAG: TSUP family transporter [Gaiellaceae bacterium]
MSGGARGRRGRLLGLAGGFVGGMLGVGGGIVFIPALALVLGLSQVAAEATSLLAIMAVGAAGAWRQHGYGNLRPRDGALMGVLSVAGVAAGVALANVLPEHALRLLFAAVMLCFAASLFRRALRV